MITNSTTYESLVAGTAYPLSESVVGSYLRGLISIISILILLLLSEGNILLGIIS